MPPERRRDEGGEVVLRELCVEPTRQVPYLTAEAVRVGEFAFRLIPGLPGGGRAFDVPVL